MTKISDSSENPHMPTTGVHPAPTEQAPHTPQVSAGVNPKLDKRQKQGFTGGTWIALILGALILIMLLIFILQNQASADFAYLGWTFTLPLGIAMLFAAIGGMLVMGLFGSVRLIKVSHRVRKLEKEREELKRTLR